MSLLHTFSMEVKTDARLPRSERFASIMGSCVLSASCGTRRRIRTIRKMGVVTFSALRVRWPFSSQGLRPFFSTALIRLRLPEGAEELHYAWWRRNRSLLGSPRIDFHSHRECMEEDYEYANKLGKQGGKNPRKLSIDHERFSRTIEKKSKITPTHSS